ncbi:single-stranded DNA-binding protein, partial [Candidatus Parcubacteria bacterium]|nr:single-stranded DNA-binding protein [Candidatus Parcubacteria bacterium]
MDLNKVMLIGNVVRDPELKTIPSGQQVASFSIATNLVWTDKSSGQKQTRAEFHNIVVWRKLAEICGQYLKKGSKIYIEGRLQTRDWVGQDGVKRYRTEVIADNMIMLGGGGGGNSSQFQPSQQNSAPAASAKEEIPTIQQEDSPNSGQENPPKSSDDEEINV